MSDIKHREQKMGEKGKKTHWREFVKKICSLCSLSFYKNNGYISKYPVNKERKLNLVESRNFIEKADENTKYGLNYIFSKTFFENYQTLLQVAALPHCIQVGEENIDYADNVAWGSKNVYLSYGVFYEVENAFYSFHVKQNCHNVFNSIMVWDNCSNIYTAVGIMKSYNIYYSRYIYNSNNIWFSSNLTGCTECIDCQNLENRSYCISNQQYTKEEFLEKKEKLLVDKQDFYKKYFDLPIEAKNNLSENVSGMYITESQNIENGQLIYKVRDSRNIILVGAASGDDQDIYNSFVAGSPYAHNIYGSFNLGGSDNVYFSEAINGCQNIYYSNYIINCSYCLGCIGLKNKSFCILNKQYTKEERFELANKIFAQMDKDGTLGQFFPGWMNPFYFNDTAAYLIDDSFTKEEVEAEGYLRRDEKIKVDVPAGAEVITISDIDQYQGRMDNGTFTPQSEIRNSQLDNSSIEGKRHINPDILKKVIQDEKGNYYRIVPMELEFLQKHGLPLPEIHWLDRIKLGFKFK